MDIAELVATLGLSLDEESWNRANELIERARKGVVELHKAGAEHEGGEKEGGLGKELKEGLETFVGYEGIKSIKEMVEGTVEATIAAKHLGERLGMTTEAVQTLGYAAKVSGASQETLTIGLQRLSYGLQQTGMHGMGAHAALAKLHISAESIQADLKGEGLDAVLENIAERFKAMKDGPEKVAVAMQLFGRTAGPQLIPLLNQGKAGIKELREEAERLGVPMGEEGVERAHHFEIAMARLHARIGAIKDAIVVMLLPVLTTFLDVMSEIVAFLREHEGAMIVVFGAIAAAITYLLIPAVKKLWEALIGPFGKFEMVAAAVVGMAAEIEEAWEEGLSPLKAILLGLGLLIMGIFSPILVPLTLATALVIGLVKHWEEVRDGVAEAGEAIRDAFEDIGEWFAELPIIKQVIEAVKWIKDNIGRFSPSSLAGGASEATMGTLNRLAGQAERREMAGTLYSGTKLGALQPAEAPSGPRVTVHSNVTIHAGNMKPHEVTKAMDDHHNNIMREAHNAVRRGGK